MDAGRWRQRHRARRDAPACKQDAAALAAGVGSALLQALIVALFRAKAQTLERGALRQALFRLSWPQLCT